MKTKLTINGIINLFTIVGFVLFLVGIFQIINKIDKVTDNLFVTIIDLLKGNNIVSGLLHSAYLTLAGVIILIISWMLQMVIGVLILTSLKEVKHNTWLASLTGILSLFGGLCGLNAIFSFMGLKFIKVKARK